MWYKYINIYLIGLGMIEVITCAILRVLKMQEIETSGVFNFLLYNAGASGPYRQNIKYPIILVS